MGAEDVRGLLAATRASLGMLLMLPLLVLVGFVNSHPSVIIVLSVGLAVHALLCLLAFHRLRSASGYLLLAGVFLLLGVVAAAALSLRMGYDLEKSFALIFCIVVAAVALDYYRIHRHTRLHAGFWAGLSFQAGLLLYFLLA